MIFTIVARVIHFTAVLPLALIRDWPFLSLNLNISKTMAYTEFKLGVLILHTHPEGMVSQIFHLGLGFYFMPKIGKLFAKFLNHIKR